MKIKTGSPGPANYPAGNLKTTMPRAPEYSLYARSNLANKSFVPGANAYDRMNYKPGITSPSYSFGVRHSLRAPPMIVPCDNVWISGKNRISLQFDLLLFILVRKKVRFQAENLSSQLNGLAILNYIPIIFILKSLS